MEGRDGRAVPTRIAFPVYLRPEATGQIPSLKHGTSGIRKPQSWAYVLKSKTTATDVVVAVAGIVVQIDGEHPRIRVVVPVTADDRKHIRNPPLARKLTSPRAICPLHQFFVTQHDVYVNRYALLQLQD